MPETLLSLSNILLYGRVMVDLQYVGPTPVKDPIDDVHPPEPQQCTLFPVPESPPRLGGNTFLQEQLDADRGLAAKEAKLARIYGFSYEGHYYDLAKPASSWSMGRGTTQRHGAPKRCCLARGTTARPPMPIAPASLARAHRSLRTCASGPTTRATSRSGWIRRPVPWRKSFSMSSCKRSAFRHTTAVKSHVCAGTAVQDGPIDPALRGWQGGRMRLPRSFEAGFTQALYEPLDGCGVPIRRHCSPVFQREFRVGRQQLLCVVPGLLHLSE